MGNAKAQDEGEKIRILFIFDCSNSMFAQWEKSSKIKVAKRLLNQTLDSLKGIENIEIALRAYGHQYKITPGNQRCDDIELLVPFGQEGDANIDRIKNKIRGLEPKGTTPIALSLEAAADDFPPCDNCRNVVILITDGIEACEGLPCAAARKLKEKGINLKPFIIGIGLDTSYMEHFSCVGEFLSADTEAGFKSVMDFVVSQALNNTTVQVNLLDINKKVKETDVTMSFYDQNSGKLLYTYMHTMDQHRKPDTLPIDPLHRYRLEVHTTPPMIKEHIKLTPGKHNIIEVDAPRGTLNLRIHGTNTPYSGINCIVRKHGEMRTLNVQPMNKTHLYIVGEYDLEILTLPRLYMEKVKINQSKTTPITIPNSGILHVNKGNGPCAIFQMKDGRENWVCDLTYEGGIQSFNLLPGKYKVVYRYERNTSSANTIEQHVKIASGIEESLNF